MATRWGFIGAGQMGGALVRGLVRAGVARADEVWICDPSVRAVEVLGAELPVHVVGSNGGVVAESDVVVLAVKPQVLASVMEEIRPVVSGRHLVVSVAAGVTLAALREGLGEGVRLIRVMPNTPALIGAGVAAYCLDASATEEDGRLVRSILEGVGCVHEVPEGWLDGVTGLSGSGPAFVYQVIEAMSDGGVRVGLPRALASALAAQTVLGAARMVLETGKHPAELKDEVASPGGTTIAGLHALERGGMRAALMDAVEAAARRSAELSRLD